MKRRTSAPATTRSRVRAVNPVLREGNSDRRAPLSVKNYARQNPHSMGAWTSESKTNVATMDADDFRSNEKSVVIEADTNLKIQLVKEDGTVKVLKRAFPVLAGEVIDGTVMRAAALDAFLAAQVARAKEEGVLFSAHLKATMMKVSDPIIFGHVVKAYFADLFDDVRSPDRRRRPESEQRTRLHPQRPRGPPRGDPRRRRSCHPEGPERRPRAGHGRFRQGHHQPARPLRRDRGRLHACHDPQLRPHVGPRRPGSRHARRPPGQQLRRHLPGGPRRLPRTTAPSTRPPWVPSRTSA